jgi:hypothetical protein
MSLRTCRIRVQRFCWPGELLPLRGLSKVHGKRLQYRRPFSSRGLSDHQWISQGVYETRRERERTYAPFLSGMWFSHLHVFPETSRVRLREGGYPGRSGDRKDYASELARVRCLVEAHPSRDPDLPERSGVACCPTSACTGPGGSYLDCKGRLLRFSGWSPVGGLVARGPVLRGFGDFVWRD